MFAVTKPILDANPYAGFAPQKAAAASGACYLSELPECQLRWLWPGRVPIGGLTLLVGDPGIGKSLVALDIAARASRGTPWPDEPVKSHETRVESQNAVPGSGLSALDSQPSPPSPCDIRHSESADHSSFDISHSSFSPPLDPLPRAQRKPCTVMLLTAEDDLNATVIPRVVAMGGDRARFLTLPAVYEENSDDVERRIVNLRCHLSRIRNLLAVTQECRLLILDSLNAFVGAGDPLAVLVPLADMARDLHLAVLAISHLRKKEGALIHRALGSLSYVAFARASWVVSKDPADAERRLLLPIKNNLTAAPSGLAYTIAASAAGGAPVVQWSPEPVVFSADRVVGPKTEQAGHLEQERDYARRWISSRLASGPCPSKQVLEEAREVGITPYTLRRAFRQLGGEVMRVGFGPAGHWVWQLPSIDVAPAGEEGAHL